MVDETSRLDVEIDGTGAAADIGRIERAFEKLQATVARTSAAFNRLGSSTTSAFRRMRGAASATFRVMSAGFRGLRRVMNTFTSVFKSVIKGVLIGGAAFTAFARSVTSTGNQINKFVNTLVILKGNTADATRELEFLFNMSQSLGTSFTAAAQPFTKFAAAAAGTLNDQAIRDVFESFATVGVALQLTQSEVTGVFLALQQIASKGVVSMEELRLQLAERVPGAMRLAASSMGMTMADFEKAVQNRTINAGEFLEKFSKKLKDTFGIAAQIASERLFADIQRLGNAFTAFRQNVFQAGFEEGLKNLVRSATGFLQNNPALADALGRFSKGIFDNLANFLDSLTADRVVNILNAMIGAFESLINVLNRVAFEVRQLFDDDFNVALDSVREETRAFETMVRDRNRLARVAGGEIALNFASREEDLIFGPASEAQIENAQRQLEGLDEKIHIARGRLTETRMEARALGITLGDLPTDPFQQLAEDAERIGPALISIPRIEALPSSGGEINITNQPITPPSVPPAVFDALDQADALSDVKMPAFFSAIISGEIRNGMDELQRLTFDLNVLIDAQELSLAAIEERQARINELRAMDPANVNATELNDLIREQTKATEDFLAAEEKRFELTKKQNDELERRNKILEQSKSFQKSLEETFTSVQDVVFNSIKKTEDAIVDLVMTGKLNFKDLANSIIRELVRMAVQAFITRFILGPLLGNFTQNLGDQLGGTLSTPQGIPTQAFAHSGGIAGGDRLDSRTSGSGFDRLRRNEMPIVVEKGEGIFTQQQMRALAPVAEVARATRNMATARTLPEVHFRPVVNVQPGSGTKVEVVNNSGSEATIEESVSSDGQELIRVVIGAVAQDIAGDGPISRTMKGKFGLRNRTGLR